MRQRARIAGPAALAVALLVILVALLFEMGRALAQAGDVQPAEPWMPTPKFSRETIIEYPVTLTLWPPGMAGQQPLRSLAIQFDNSRLYQENMLLTLRNSDNSTSQFLFKGSDVHDNDYVEFPMDGKTPVSGAVTSFGNDSATVIGVSGPDVDTATCAIYELMDGKKLTVPGCS
jgi:hypothetical protein